jgi:phosphopantothenoylcysteine decarboxylase/phosphopantothenate--cysteine ligase
VYFAPAMDLDMWKHFATQENIQKLQSFGNILINPAFGELASGLVGEGRMAEPEQIVDFLLKEVKKKLPLVGKRALVTAGPTYEAIDPVRFIGNHSSGKMGYALAEELYHKGAEVTLVSGPTSLQVQGTSIRRIDVTSASEMAEQVIKYFPESDITIMSAAVADYRPKEIASSKIKKESPEFTIELVKTTDILSTIGQSKRTNQILVGFALETNDEEVNAIKKLNKKNLDFIVLNSLQDKGAGFKGDSNKVTFIDRDLKKEVFKLKSKKEVAVDICQRIIGLVE